MPHAHLTRGIKATGARQIAATGLVLSVFALPAPALAQGGLIGGFVGGMVNQGFQQPQSPPQYYQPPPQQYYQPSTQQYNPQSSPPNNQQQFQQTNQQSNDQFIRDEEEAERLRHKRAAAIAARKAKTQNPPADKAQNVSVDKAQPPAVEQEGRDDATIASATPNPRSATAQPIAAVQPNTMLPAFPDQTAYADARNRLIALGYGPSPSGSQHCDPAKDESCYPEREFCFGSSVIQCNFSWKHGDTVIRVQTVNLPPTIAKVEWLDNCQ